MDIVKEKIIVNRPIILDHYNKLVDSEYLPDIVSDRNQRFLMDQIQYMRASSDYYNRLLKKSTTEQWVKEVWNDIPIMNKQTLMEHFDSICTTDDIQFEEVEKYLQNKDLVDTPYSNPDYMVVSTAGTSGQLGYFAYSLEEQAFLRALYCRFLRAVVNNMDANEPIRTCSLIMTGAHLFGYKMQKDIPSSQYRIIPVMQNGRPTAIDEIVERISKFNPHILICYGSTMRMIMEYKKDNPALKWNPRAIINTGATIEADVKNQCRSIFPGAAIFDFYASTDLGYIAWTCEHGSMHLNSDCFHLELLDDHHKPVPSGQYGSVVITSYWHRTLPVLRYEIGDLLSLRSERCECGRNLSVVDKLLGRKNTLLYRKIDEKLDPVPQGVIMELFENIPGLRYFRLLQKSINCLEVQVVPVGNDETLSRRVECSLQNIFGVDTNIKVTCVEKITPNSQSGKVIPVERTFQPGDMT